MWIRLSCLERTLRIKSRIHATYDAWIALSIYKRLRTLAAELWGIGPNMKFALRVKCPVDADGS